MEKPIHFPQAVGTKNRFTVSNSTTLFTRHFLKVSPLALHNRKFRRKVPIYKILVPHGKVNTLIKLKGTYRYFYF